MAAARGHSLVNSASTGEAPLVVLFANTDWYLFNFRLPLARELASKGFRVHLIAPHGDYCDRLRFEFPLSNIDIARKGLNPIADVHTLWQLIRVLQSLRPSYIHLFTAKCVVYGSIAAKVVGGCRIINAITGMGFAYSGNGVRKLFVRGVLRLLYSVALSRTQVVFQNPDDLNWFINSGLVRATNAHLIPSSGVNVERFAPALGTRERTFPTVLMAARLVREKGVLDYFQAASLVARTHPDARFLLAGSPDPGNPSSLALSELARLANESGVELVGHVDDMAMLLRDVDLVVLPSYYGEGIPRSLVEAAASGLPLITTDMPGCREIVRHQINGLLVPAKSPSLLAHAIALILSSSETQTRFGAAARKIAVEEYSEQVVLANTLKLCYSSPAI